MHRASALLASLFWVFLAQSVLAEDAAARPDADAASSGPATSKDKPSSASPSKDKPSSASPSKDKPSSADPVGRDTERALDFGHRALSAAEDEDWQTAYELFAQAERLVHSPVFLLYLARSAWRLGRLTEARRLLLECSHEQLDSHAPGPWREAVEEARVALQVLELWIPSATLLFPADAAFPMTVRIAGQTRSALDSTPIVFYQDEGRHELRITDAQGQHQVLAWHARRGSKAQFVLPQAPREPAALQRASTSLRDARRSSRPFYHAAVASFVSGGAALVVSSSAFAVALGVASEVKSRCDGNQCHERERGPAGQAMRAGNLATAGLVVAGVGALSGVTLLVMARPHKPQALRLSWDLRGLRLSGEF